MRGLRALFGGRRPLPLTSRTGWCALGAFTVPAARPLLPFPTARGAAGEVHRTALAAKASALVAAEPSPFVPAPVQFGISPRAIARQRNPKFEGYASVALRQERKSYPKSRFVFGREASEPNRDLNGSGDTPPPHAQWRKRGGNGPCAMPLVDYTPCVVSPEFLIPFRGFGQWRFSFLGPAWGVF